MNKWHGLQNCWIVKTFEFNKELQHYVYYSNFFIFVGGIARFDQLVLILKDMNFDERIIYEIENSYFLDTEENLKRAKMYSRYFIFDYTPKKKKERENLKLSTYPTQLFFNF